MENKTIKRAKFQRSTQDQLRFYMKFCTQHPELQSKKGNPELWRELVTNLNALRGPTRTVAKWKENFSQWRSQIRCRARKARKATLKAADENATKQKADCDHKNQWTEQDVSRSPVIDILPCIDETEFQDSNAVESYQGTLIDGLDFDVDFDTSQIKIEGISEDDVSADIIVHNGKFLLRSESQSPRPSKTTAPSSEMCNGISSDSAIPAATAVTNTTSINHSTNSAENVSQTAPSEKLKRVTPATIYNAMLESIKKRDEAEERAAELQLQTVRVLKHLGHSLLTISETLTKLNEKLDKLVK